MTAPHVASERYRAGTSAVALVGKRGRCTAPGFKERTH
jgi:hypothetical protein